ncbi:serglycin [Drosophila gunungcola]|uniref:Uncharacterized protein n=1 Tax=Drosophila gunungcola TaxID=103775 RepID=A0A9P9YVA1_9MUSC|nr:serglycin [Drosophila gunungcola]KAI8043737.1 hypothetical protein M5D96_005075 [Drosophila gunungcola]
MVYTERTDKCLSSTTKDNHSSKGQSQSKSASGSGSGSGSVSGSGSGSWSSQASSAEKWKYNNMVNNDRQQFNGMHFS